MRSNLKSSEEGEEGKVPMGLEGVGEWDLDG